MEKLRAETLDEILKKEKAYPHELRAIIPELKLLREIYDGKKPSSAYGLSDIRIVVPAALIEADDYVAAGDAYLLQSIGQTNLVKVGTSTVKRWILHRVK